MAQTSMPAPISVVIPAYNAESFIAEAIQSVRAQTLKVADIIVVADDCTDRTAKIAAELGATVLEVKRRNPSAARNLGIRSGTQPWIALLDADDFWDQDKIALQWKAIQACPDAAIISCDISMFSNQLVTPPPQEYVRKRWKYIKHVSINDHCRYLEKVDGDGLLRLAIPTPAAMIRRDVVSSVGNFDESLIFGQHLEFFARVLARYPLAFVEKPLVYQRIHDRNHTKNLAGAWASYVSIVDRMLKHPELYPEGAGEAHRKWLKETFHTCERAVARQRGLGRPT